MSRIAMLAMICVSIALAVPANAATYYVATTGNDNNPGTSGSPFRTIQKGIDKANAGDTVEVAAGSYRERLILDSSDGGRPGAPVTIHGASGAIIDGSNDTSALSWSVMSGDGGDVYQTYLGYDTNAVFVNDYTLQELWDSVAWAPLTSKESNPFHFDRMMTYSFKDVAGWTNHSDVCWGQSPAQGWDAIGGISCVDTSTARGHQYWLFVKCKPNGESQPGLNIASLHASGNVKISSKMGVAVTIDGANDVIFDGFAVKYAYYGFKIKGNSIGCEIKNCTIKPCTNGVWLEGGATGVSVHNNEMSPNSMGNRITKSQCETWWHGNKCQLEPTDHEDKYGILWKESGGNHRIYDNWVHGGGSGIHSGSELPPAESALVDMNVEVDHNLVQDGYQDAVSIGRNLSNHKWHHNVLNNCLQFGRLFDVHWGPGFIYNNIMIPGPCTNNGVVMYMDTDGQAPPVYFYHNTLAFNTDQPIGIDGPLTPNAWQMNNVHYGGDSQVNHHFYNNLLWVDRWFINISKEIDANNTYLSEPMWQADSNVYVRRGTAWLNNKYDREVNGTSYSGTNPATGWDYAHADSHVTPHGTYDKVVQEFNSLWTTASPGFTDFVNDDLSLTSTSPARNEAADLTAAFGFTPPGDLSSDCGALAYGQPMLDVPGTSGGAASTPRITTLAPSTGGSVGGNMVTVIGSNMNGASVSFGGTAATNVAVNPSGSHLTCTAPAHSAGAVNVTITTSLGTSDPLSYTYTQGETQATLYPSEDTMVSKANSTTNYGSSNNFQVQSNEPNYNLQALLRFDLSALGGRVTSAKLRVYKNGASSAITVTASDCNDDSWSEATVNWSNRPSIGSARATVDATTTGWKEWDLTTYVGEKIGGPMTVYLSDAVTTRNVWTQWWSSEYSNASLRPVLVVSIGSDTSTPTLSGIAPTSGTTAGGTACTLTGANLTGCSAVSFGGTAATGIVVDSATQVRCTSPAKSAGAASVTATTSNGTSNGVTFTYTTVPPTLSSIAPTSGTTAGGTACTLTGTNLTGCSAVSFGGTAASGIVVDSATQVRCTSPAESAGSVSVTATTAGGTSNGVTFTYTTVPPTLSSIAPTSGITAGGTACTLTGTNLTGCSAVSFGGTAATGIVVDSATQVRCTSPAKSAGTYSVTATTGGGTSNGVNFTYIEPAPTLSSIAPTSGDTAGGTACTLTGTNLTGCSAVSFGGTAATGIVVDSATQVRCTSPAKTAATYSVTATTAGGTSNGVNFTYTGGGTTYTNTLYPAADSMASAASTSRTYGSYDNMQVQKTTGSVDMDSYLKFDLSTCQGTTVTSAKLRLYKNGNTTSHVINAFSCSNDSWAEATLCWNNRPTKGTSQTTATVQNTGWYEWTITSYVNTEFAGDKVVTVIMSEENSLNIWTQWWSKEKTGTTYDPYLVVISQ